MFAEVWGGEKPVTFMRGLASIEPHLKSPHPGQRVSDEVKSTKRVERSGDFGNLFHSTF